MRPDPDPWYSREFWQRAIIAILMLALAWLLASPAEGVYGATLPAAAMRA